jgi:hypothetical protein
MVRKRMTDDKYQPTHELIGNNMIEILLLTLEKYLSIYTISVILD